MKKSVDPANRKHHFFKVLLDEDETRMRIPEAFYPRISRASQSCKQAVIQGPSKAYWFAKVNNSRDGIYLEKGWEVFVEENGLEIFDFLVFRYDGNMQFSVKVFNMYGFPREECFAPVRSSLLSGERIRCGRPSRERRFLEQQWQRQQDRDESDEKEDEDELDEDESSENEWDADKSDENEDEDESDEDELDDDDEDDGYEVPKQTRVLNSSRKKRSKSTNMEEYVARADAIERRFTSVCSYPFFKIMMHPSYLKVNYLPVPRAVRKEYVPDDLKYVIMKASGGRAWKIKLLHSKSDVRFSKGVSDFKNGMNLKVGDVCIFQIIKKCPPKKQINKKRSYRLVLKVHHFPN